MLRVALFLALFMLPAGALWAQLLSDGGTEVVSGTKTNLDSTKLLEVTALEAFV